MTDLTLDEANELVGDDIEFWLRNQFLDYDLLAAKVLWWISQAAAATPAPAPSALAATEDQ